MKLWKTIAGSFRFSECEVCGCVETAIFCGHGKSRRSTARPRQTDTARDFDRKVVMCRDSPLAVASCMPNDETDRAVCTMRSW
jgi:hypothetical protein